MTTSDRRHHSTPPSEERRYLRLVETFAQSVWEADPSGHLIPGSLSGQTAAGRSHDTSEVIGWLDAVHPDDRQAVESAWHLALAEGGIYRHEYRSRWDGRGWVWTLAHAAPVFDDNGKPLKWLGMNVDISARKAAEQALRDADRQKDEFISVLAHELRNPLAPLRSGIDLLLNETATSVSKARALALMSRQTFHISRLVEDLIDASRITTGQLQVHLQERRLADILRAAIDNIQPAIDAKRQQLTLEGLDEFDPVVNADVVRLNQAVVNLLNNSAKFSPESSAIQITVYPHDQHVGVTVRDRGRTIPESDLPNIFKLFVQSARHDPGDGLSIGLSLASDVIKLHHGTLQVRNAPDGVGAEFEIRLPMVAVQAAQHGTDPDASAFAWKSLRVLVVDDNADAAEALGALLELAGHTLRIVHDGAQAVQEATTFLPDVIFMDMGMPVMGGLEATQKIRALELSVRPFVIALTGWSSDADRAASQDAGCDMHMAKPIEFAEVERVLARRTALRAG